MSAAANFAATPHASAILVNTANTNTDGTGTLATVFTAGAAGSRVDSLKIKAIVAVGATQAADAVRIYIDDTTNKHPLTEQSVPVGTGNVSVSLPNAEFTIALGIVLPAGWMIKASTHIGGATASYHVTAFGGDF